MGRKKDDGRGRLGGRTKGTPNKQTQITRGILNDIAMGLIEQVMKDIAELEPKDRVQVFLKLAEFNISKPQSIDLGITSGHSITIEQELSEMAEDQDN